MKETWAETELTYFPPITETDVNTFVRSEKQNRIGIKVNRNGFPCNISGTVSAICMLPDGTSFEFNQNGSVSGNRASIVLPDACYAQNGRIGLSLVLTSGNARTTLGVFLGTVYPTRI